MNISIFLEKGGKLPEYKTDGASCMDCFARISAVSGIKIPMHSRCLINLGFRIAIPFGYEGIIKPRSGLTSKDCVDVAIGTIDSDYRGEVKACVINNSNGDYEIHPDDRICQLDIQRSERIDWKIVSSLDETERGENGFGSTGLN